MNVQRSSESGQCECGWPADEAQLKAGHCFVCHETMPDGGRGALDHLDHLRVMHPDQYGDGPKRWPDGGLVIEEDLSPDQFGGGPS